MSTPNGPAVAAGDRTEATGGNPNAVVPKTDELTTEDKLHAARAVDTEADKASGDGEEGETSGSEAETDDTSEGEGSDGDDSSGEYTSSSEEEQPPVKKKTKEAEVHYRLIEKLLSLEYPVITTKMVEFLQQPGM
jgi:hypothetical protein